MGPTPTSTTPSAASGSAPGPRSFGASVERLLGERGSSPALLRLAMAVTASLAIVFAALGAYGVGRRDAGIADARRAATALRTLQDIRVRVVGADSVASRAYLSGGGEQPADRAAYLDQLQTATSELVGLSLPSGDGSGELLAKVNGALTSYSGLIEQARANNRQGFPIGAAYQREANAIITALIVPDLRTVEQSQRGRVNDRLASAHRAGAWMNVVGWGLLAVVVLAGVWLARRFRRLINVPLAAGAVLLVLLLLIGGTAQRTAINNADGVVTGSLTADDLVAQARAAAFDAHAQEALTLINRGNGASNEVAFQKSSGIVDTALQTACDRTSQGCDLRAAWTQYTGAHTALRTSDDGGDWDGAVKAALNGAARVSFDAFDTTSGEELSGFASRSAAGFGDATSSLGALRLAVLLVGLVVAALAVVGIGQRLREYR